MSHQYLKVNMAVLVSQGCCKTVPQTRCPRTIEIDCLRVLDAGCLKSKCEQGGPLCLWHFQEASVLASWAARCSSVCGSVISTSVSIYSWPSSVCPCVLSSPYRRSSRGFRAHPKCLCAFCLLCHALSDYRDDAPLLESPAQSTVSVNELLPNIFVKEQWRKEVKQLINKTNLKKN